MKGVFMTTVIMSEDGKQKTGCQSVSLDKSEWSLQRFRVALRDWTGEDLVYGDGNYEGDHCRIMLCLRGQLRVCASGSEPKEDFFVNAGSCCLHYSPCPYPCQDCTHQHRAQAMELVCPAVELLSLVGDTRVGRNLKEAVKERKPLHIHQPLTPSIHQAMVSLQEAAAESDSGYGALVLAKTLIMVWLFTRSENLANKSRVSSETRQAIEKTQSILEKNMTDPPALEHLAAEVGMSLSKFKQVFPKVCGVPPYTYLRRIRLERAMKLLAQNRLSVTEAALEVGYSILSHFTSLYRSLWNKTLPSINFQQYLSYIR
jgi:AraC-like DNA-binding protein